MRRKCFVCRFYAEEAFEAQYLDFRQLFYNSVVLLYSALKTGKKVKQKAQSVKNKFSYLLPEAKSITSLLVWNNIVFCT